MTDTSFDRLRTVFDEAMKLEGNERRDAIETFCDAYPEDADALRQLIVGVNVDDDFFHAPIKDAVKHAHDSAVDPWIGRQIDHYRIVKRIATGGMGSVFLAERSDDEFQQQVAVKMMSARLLGPDAIQRFRIERQLLANLQHPYIAGLIDGGTTESGLPYLVMPFIEGVPIDQYCNDCHLSVKQRLQLVIKVGEAVDFAHRNLVVHRDLKPNNILIDSRGDPKLLDFGIAKLLRGNALDGVAARTQEGMRSFTPECASPEQVRGEAVSVATDIYALGVLMFRLLTGQSPYTVQTPSSHELANAIVSSEPRRPSAVVTGASVDRNASASIDIGVDFAEVPQRLRRMLTGDLDNIVLMSLQKEPERRYHSVRAQIEDTRNFLEQRPVAARPDTFVYRVGKFVSRHVAAVTTATAVVFGLIAMTTYYTARLATERDIAQQERQAAEQVTNFLVDIFAATEAGKPDAETVTVREVLDRGADKIDASLADQPLIHARLLQHIARTYSSIARYDDAVVKYGDALSIFKRETGQSADTADAHYRLANVYLSLRDWKSAHESYLTALNMHRAQSKLSAKKIAEVLRLLVYTSQALGNNEEAESYLNEMLPLVKTAYGPDDPEFANSLYSKATLQRTLGNYEEAIINAKSALSIIVNHHGADAGETVNYRHVVGLIEWDRGNYVEALEHYERGIAIRSGILSSEHPSLFNIVFSRGATLAKLERYSDAAASHEQLVKLQREALGPDNVAVAYTEGAYGMVLLELEQVDKAEASFVNANRIWELAHGPNYQESGVATIGLGHVARARGNVNLARTYYQSGIALRENSRGQEHPATARAVVSLADLEFEAGDLVLATNYYLRALAIYQDPAHPLKKQAQAVRERIDSIDASIAP